MPTFDLDAMMNRLVEQKSQLYGLQFTQAQVKWFPIESVLIGTSIGRVYW